MCHKYHHGKEVKNLKNCEEKGGGRELNLVSFAQQRKAPPTGTKDRFFILTQKTLNRDVRGGCFTAPAKTGGGEDRGREKKSICCSNCKDPLEANGPGRGRVEGAAKHVSPQPQRVRTVRKGEENPHWTGHNRPNPHCKTLHGKEKRTTTSAGKEEPTKRQ